MITSWIWWRTICLNSSTLMIWKGKTILISDSCFRLSPSTTGKNTLIAAHKLADLEMAFPKKRVKVNHIRPRDHQRVMYLSAMIWMGFSSCLWMRNLWFWKIRKNMLHHLRTLRLVKAIGQSIIKTNKGWLNLSKIWLTTPTYHPYRWEQSTQRRIISKQTLSVWSPGTALSSALSSHPQEIEQTLR